MATTSVAVLETPLVLGLLRRADDALVLAHRLSEWCGHAPVLEEDIALPNIALDLLGTARALYEYAAEVEAGAHVPPRAPVLDEDALAFLRDDRQYRNALITERPNGDFAHTIARQFLFSALADPAWRALMQSADARLAAIAAKAEKESAYHLRHSAEWLIRLGDGTELSHARAQAAVDALWPYTGEMFEADDAERALIDTGITPDPAGLRPVFDRTVDSVFAEATLTRPADGWMHSGGRIGRHSEHLGPMLAEMQILPRTFPGATW